MGLFDVLFLGVLTVMLTFGSMFAFLLYLNINSNTLYLQNVPDTVRSNMTTTFNGIDYVIPFLFLVMVLITGAIAVNTPNSVLMSVFFILILIFNIVLGDMMTRFYTAMLMSNYTTNSDEINYNILSYKDTFPMTNFLITNYVYLSSIMLSIVGISAYAIKTRL